MCTHPPHTPPPPPQALESQAGFPLDGAATCALISRQQWDEFVAQYRSVLGLLRQIAAVWNVEDPCVIAGFDMDRMGTVQALSGEPAGGWLCLFGGGGFCVWPQVGGAWPFAGWHAAPMWALSTPCLLLPPPPPLLLLQAPSSAASP